MAISSLVALSAVSAGVAYTGQKSAAKNAKEANRVATQNAQETLDASTQANNKANQKRPDGSTLLSSNAAAAKGGQSGTMLTGPGGIDPSVLQLGKTTLLGGGA